MSDQDIIPSPCQRVCAVDGRSGFCMGCYRTLKEITQWSGFSNDEKSQVLQEIDERKRIHGPITLSV
jgi:hypothetical protein